MKLSRIPARRPSPALIVALLALVAALSGVAYALPGKNTIDSGDIINKEVKTSDLAPFAVRGKHVKGNALGGTQIKESTLGIVPTAETAQHAMTAASASTSTSATTATTADTAKNADAVVGRIPFAVDLNIGQQKTIAANGPVWLTATCAEAGGGHYRVSIIAATTANNAVMSGEDNFGGIGNVYLMPGTPAADSELLTLSSAETLVSTQIDKGFVMGPQGDYLGVDGESTAIGVRYGASDCILRGVVNSVD